MKTQTIDGVECLVISRNQIEKMVLNHWQNETRSRELIKKELSKQNQDQIIINMYAHQEIKARGFKEAWEELLYQFTEKMCNVDENGKLIC